jgi:hypothetical protein
MESRTLRQENRRDFVRGSKGFSLSGYVWSPADVKVSFYSNHRQGFNQAVPVVRANKLRGHLTFLLGGNDLRGQFTGECAVSGLRAEEFVLHNFNSARNLKGLIMSTFKVGRCLVKVSNLEQT